MKVSNRIKRNIHFVLLLVGIACIIARIWEVVVSPSSGKAWFELFGAIILTYICFDSYIIYYQRVKSGIIFGSR